MRAQAIIDKQDMEQLAAMVLSGDGQYLIGAKSNLPEIQAFIDNVPAYMVKHSPHTVPLLTFRLEWTLMTFVSAFFYCWRSLFLFT